MAAFTLVTANRNYSSWSLRPWVLMKALGIPFADRIEPFTKPSNYEEFRAFSPTGQVPVLIDGARTVWDSLGIVLYLADRHRGVWPKSDEARAFAQSAVTEMHGGFSALRSACTRSFGTSAAAAMGRLIRFIECIARSMASSSLPFPSLSANFSAEGTPFRKG